MSSARDILVNVEATDALEFPSDVLALKYAQALHGLDRVVYGKLTERTGAFRLPAVSEYALLPTGGAIRPGSVLFVGVEPLHAFGYEEIREFARSVLASLADKAERFQHVSLTLHGARAGLDETEAFKAEIAGILDAIGSRKFPPDLARITFVETDQGRARRLLEIVGRLLPGNRIPLDREGAPEPLGGLAREALQNTGAASNAKSFVFVAMPFAKEMDDLFHYGIQGAVNSAGFLCERADLATFTGDVMERVKTRIEASTLVVADLSTSNPNVYLEVGYAWGCGVPTVLIVKDSAELMFDVRGQRSIIYTSIRNLEELLQKELRGLRPALTQPGRRRQEAGRAVAQPPIYYDRVPGRELRRSAATTGSMRAISPRSKYWPNSARLSIRFMGGSPDQRDAVKQYAPLWTEHANLIFEFSDALDATIRVAFDPHVGSWSYTGTDAQQVPTELPTMNLASTDSATILHQFGRAIGLLPEHQNPAGGISWNEPAILAEFSGPPNYWDAETTRQQILEKYSKDQINGSSFDPESIMLLPIPARWTADGIEVPGNKTLSKRDEALARFMYP